MIYWRNFCAIQRFIHQIRVSKGKYQLKGPQGVFIMSRITEKAGVEGHTFKCIPRTSFLSRIVSVDFFW